MVALTLTQEIAETICSKIADGKSLRTICQAEGMPDRSTVFRWLAQDEVFRDQYARAREEQADALAEEIIQIADDGGNDTYTTEDGPAVNHDVIARSRLRVDARKWYASKLAPKKYGDKIEVAGDPDNPLLPKAPAELTDAQLAEIAARVREPKP